MESFDRTCGSFGSAEPIFQFDDAFGMGGRFKMLRKARTRAVHIMLAPELGNMERIKLLLLIGYALVRQSLSRQLRLDPDLEIVAECGSYDEALEALGRSAVDVLLLDSESPQDEAEFIPIARKSGYQGQILVLASEKDTAGLVRVLRAGASGVFLKHSPLDSLPRAIRQVASGAAWIDLTVLRSLAGSVSSSENPGFRSLLTKREQEVLDGVLDGLANREIASRLAISEGAEKAVLREVFRKAGVRTRSQLVRAALTGPTGVEASHPRE
jgi:DNA-binding NarL/FixJ family response regulator